MTDQRGDESLNVFDTLMMPLRLPGRVVSDIETVTRAVVSLQSDAKEHLSSVDDRAGQLIDGLDDLRAAIARIEGKVNTLEEQRMEAFLQATDKLQASVDRIEGRVTKLESLEVAVTDRIDGLRGDLNDRMVAVKGEVHAMRPPMEQMADDVSKLDELLPDPKDGPLTRLKDTFSST
jgi:chaperonin cofactor prefoldin